MIEYKYVKLTQQEFNIEDLPVNWSISKSVRLKRKQNIIYTYEVYELSINNPNSLRPIIYSNRSLNVLFHLGRINKLTYTALEKGVYNSDRWYFNNKLKKI